MNKKLLLVEDDADISNLVKMSMADIGFEVDTFSDGSTAYQKAGSRHYDFIILDVMLPGMDGLEICKQLRADGNDTPIMMLTAKAAELDRVIGLESGADDYLTKPFSISELQARVKARMRRREGAFSGEEARTKNDSAVITAGGMTIDPEKRKVKVDDEDIYLTAKEFDLLFCFASNPGRVYNREQLLDLVWGYGFEGYDHTVNSHINRLRTKIEKDPGKPKYVLTVWGVGYRFAEPAELE